MARFERRVMHFIDRGVKARHADASPELGALRHRTQRRRRSPAALLRPLKKFLKALLLVGRRIGGGACAMQLNVQTGIAAIRARRIEELLRRLEAVPNALPGVDRIVVAPRLLRVARAAPHVEPKAPRPRLLLALLELLVERLRLRRRAAYGRALRLAIAIDRHRGGGGWRGGSLRVAAAARGPVERRHPEEGPLAGREERLARQHLVDARRGHRLPHQARAPEQRLVRLQVFERGRARRAERAARRRTHHEGLPQRVALRPRRIVHIVVMRVVILRIRKRRDLQPEVAACGVALDELDRRLVVRDHDAVDTQQQLAVADARPVRAVAVQHLVDEDAASRPVRAWLGPRAERDAGWPRDRHHARLLPSRAKLLHLVIREAVPTALGFDANRTRKLRVAYDAQDGRPADGASGVRRRRPRREAVVAVVVGAAAADCGVRDRVGADCAKPRLVCGIVARRSGGRARLIRGRALGAADGHNLLHAPQRHGRTA